MLPLARIRVTEQNRDPRVFAIHSNILEHRSPFLKTLLKPETEAAGVKSELEEERSPEQDITRTIEFEGSIVAFRLYTEWVYSGLIRTRLLKVEASGAEDICFHNIGQAYVLGDKLQDYKFKNAIIELLLNTIITQGKMDLTLPTLVFDNCSVRAPLRKLLVDLYVLYGHKDWLKSDEPNATSAVFLSDLSAALLARNSPHGLRTTNLSVLSACKYYEYPEGQTFPFETNHPREIDEPKP